MNTCTWDYLPDWVYVEPWISLFDCFVLPKLGKKQVQTELYKDGPVCRSSSSFVAFYIYCTHQCTLYFSLIYLTKKDKRENNSYNFVLFFISSLFLWLYLQGLFIFLIYGVYNTEVSLHWVSRLSNWMREMTSFWWASCLKAVWMGCDRVCVWTHFVWVRGGGHRFHASVPLPFMLGLTYMHPSPTI